MRSVILIFVLYAFSFVVSGQDAKNGDVKIYFPKGELKESAVYKDGEKNGLEEVYYAPGKLWKRAHYVNGKLDGYYEEYSKYTGKLSEAGNYKNNQKDGLWKNYTLRTEEEFTDDLKNGTSVGYYQDSSLAFKTAYINGKLNGKYESWHKNGKPKEIAAYIMGVLDGERKIWYDDGKPQAEGYYINGKAEGTFRFYSGSKRVLVQEVSFRNGELTGNERQWNYNGELIREAYYTANMPTATIEYGKTPNVTYKEKFLDGYLIEKWIWDTLGKKKYHKVAINDSMYTDTLWYGNGNIHFVHAPNIQSNTLKYTVWYENGKKKKEGQLSGIRWDGVWAYYSPNGKVETEEYKYGIREKALANSDINNNKHKGGFIVVPVTSENPAPEYFFGEDYTEWPVGDMAVSIERNHEDNIFDLGVLEDGLPAKYPGGEIAGINYLQERLKRYENETNKLPKDTIIVQIAVDKFGNPTCVYTSETNAYWKKKIEVIVEAMPTWQPAIYKGRYVRRSTEIKIAY